MRGRRVLYIAGWVYGGTTLLGRLLGELDGVWFAGELRYYWRQLDDPEARCGCGLHPRECPRWRPVLEATGHLDSARIHALGERLLLTRGLPLYVLADRGRGPLAGDLREYRSALRVLYGALAAAAGGRTIVDSSKAPLYGLLLAGMHGLDVRTIQLVRDPRGSLHSRLKRNRGVDPALGLLLWGGFHVLAEASMRAPERRLLLRYEDLAADPRAGLTRITAFIASEQERFPFLVGARADLTPDHSIDGNDMRFRAGPTEIRVDDEWVSRLPRRRRALAVSLTWPLLLRYGYPLAPRRRS